MNVEILPTPEEVSTAQVPLYFTTGNVYVADYSGRLGVEVEAESLDGQKIGIPLGIVDAFRLCETIRVACQQAVAEAQERAQAANAAAQGGEA